MDLETTLKKQLQKLVVQSFMMMMMMMKEEKEEKEKKTSAVLMMEVIIPATTTMMMLATVAIDLNVDESRMVALALVILQALRMERVLRADGCIENR